jgi:hypothetical protein
MASETDKLRECVANYGMRLGIVEPLLMLSVGQLAELKLVHSSLVASKDFTNSDRIRQIIGTLQYIADYAFPLEYKK